ncbi:MAG TPA: hypothetical protein VMI75_36210 [Polyangiaceae bacterium]|nr:hypothetical protein [Polyangiaceae bacterium]
MAYDSTLRLVASATFGAACLALASCSSGEKYVFNEAEYLHQGQTLVPAGSGCSDVTLPSSGSGADPEAHVGDFNFSEGAEGDSYVVRVYSDADLLTERRYPEAMLAAGDADEFSVTTHGGAVYTLRFWGGHDCTAPH